MRSTFMKFALSVGLAAAGTVVGLAQTAPEQQGGAQGPEARREGHRRMRQHRRGMRLGRRGGSVRAFGQLNLTDAQKEQMRAIRERARGGNSEERAELRELRRQRREGGQLTPEQEARARELLKAMRESRAGVRQEMLNSLTPEQRTQLEQMRRERKGRREEFRERRMQSEPQP